MPYELRRLETYDDASLLSEVKRVAALIETPVITRAAFDRLSKVSSTTMLRHFESWEKALARAGLGNR